MMNHKRCPQYRLLLVAFGCQFAQTAIAQSVEGVMVPRTFERLNSGEPTTIVCLGDSVTGIYYHSGGRRAYPELVEIALRKRFPQTKLHVINAGVSGNTSALGLARLEKDVLQHRPHLVTVMFGLNDMTQSTLDEYRQNVVQISKRVLDSGSEILICTPNSIETSTERPTERLAEFVAAAHAVGRQQTLPVSDVFAAYETIRGKDPTEFALRLSDPIHPNMDGHKLTAAVIAGAISGQDITLADEPSYSPAIPHTLTLLAHKRPIKVFAMPPYDALIGSLLRRLNRNAQVEVSTWQVDGKTLSQIEEDAKMVRELQPDLVIIAVPFMPSMESVPGFARSYGWILNRSLSFGCREWDVLALPPSLAQPVQSDQQRSQDQLVQRLVLAQDLALLVRQPDDDHSIKHLLGRWLDEQLSLAGKTLGKQ